MYKPTFAAIGDVCVDIYPQQKQEFLGGTAYNSALAALSIGVEVSLISAVGTDSFGIRYVKSAKEFGINATHLKMIAGNTSNVTVTLDAQKRPTFSRWNLEVLKNYNLNANDLDFIANHQIAKATLLLPLVHYFDQFAKYLMQQTLKVGDFAGGSKYSCDIVSLSSYKNALDIYVRSVSKDRVAELDFLANFAKKNKKIVLATLGSNGSIVFAANKIYKQKAVKLQGQVMDTTGAGDTYVAYFLCEYLKTKNIASSMLVATEAAAKRIITVRSKI